LPPNDVRQPRLAVLANGMPLADVISADVQSNAYMAADRFSIIIAHSTSDDAFWSTLPVLIEIQMNVGAEQVSLIVGHADSVELDPIRGEAHVHGRDLTGLFISAQIAETFENQTASDIATLLAGRHGLTANVAITSVLVGRYYQIGRTRQALSQQSRATSEWDVLTWLADQEGYDMWVSGQTLNFQPPQSGTPVAALTPSTCITLRVRQALDLAAGLTVKIQSWCSLTERTVSEMATTTMGRSGGMMLTANKPNISSNDALTMAQNALSILSLHETELIFEVPGELTMAPRTTLAFSQIGSGFDGVYEIAEVDRHISFARGFVQTVVARGMPWTPS
jgi:prophage tail gpP-like protein